MIKIPTFFHELFGEYQTKSSLIIIVLFVMTSGIISGVLGYDDWSKLSFVKQLVSWLLLLDISGGVVANLTKGTDIYYHQNPKKRWIFIAIHIQPLILSWSMNVSFNYGLMIYVYTLISALILNHIREYDFQNLIAGSLTAIGLLMVIYFGQNIPFFASTLFMFYIFKVLFSFSVFHHKGEQNGH
jgi:hypothetical protein